MWVLLVTTGYQGSVCALRKGEREREREREREWKGEREGGRKRGKERERETEASWQDHHLTGGDFSQALRGERTVSPES